MIYRELFWAFLKIGFFSFGGAYAAVPLIQNEVIARGWADESLFENLLALAESSPGPIMVNAATFIGSRQAGLPGAAVATLGVVLPSFILILLLTIVFRHVIRRPAVRAALAGLKPALTGIIMAVGLLMLLRHIWPQGEAADGRALGILLFLAAAAGLWRKVKKRPLSPFVLIALGGAAGLLLY